MALASVTSVLAVLADRAIPAAIPDWVSYPVPAWGSFLGFLVALIIVGLRDLRGPVDLGAAYRESMGSLKSMWDDERAAHQSQFARLKAEIVTLQNEFESIDLHKRELTILREGGRLARQFADDMTSAMYPAVLHSTEELLDAFAKSGREAEGDVEAIFLAGREGGERPKRGRKLMLYWAGAHHEVATQLFLVMAFSSRMPLGLSEEYRRDPTRSLPELFEAWQERLWKEVDEEYFERDTAPEEQDHESRSEG